MTEESNTVLRWIPAVQEFQTTFSPYFPKLSEDFDTAERQMGWLHNSVWGNPLDTVRRAQARRDLQKLMSSLKNLGADLPFLRHMYASLYRGKTGGDEVAADAHQVLKFLLRLNVWRYDERLDPALERFAAEAEKAINAIPETLNVNWEAVHAIDCLRVFWRMNKWREAPARALNPASTFADFLNVGFSYLEIDGDPVSAFKRWVVKVGAGR